MGERDKKRESEREKETKKRVSVHDATAHSKQCKEYSISPFILAYKSFRSAPNGLFLKYVTFSASPMLAVAE